MQSQVNQETFKEIGAFALEIYRRMPLGATIQLNVPESKIITLGDPTPKNGGFLVISKPNMMVGLNTVSPTTPKEKLNEKQN